MRSVNWPNRARSPRRDRGTGIGGLMAQIVKAEARKRAGEIHTIPNGYKFSADGYINPGGVLIAARPTFDDRQASLVSGQRTATNCPNPPGDFPTFKADDLLRVYVPMKVCRRCPYHLKRAKGQPFPCCEVLRELQKNEPSPVSKAFSLLREAEERAKEIMGR